MSLVQFAESEPCKVCAVSIVWDDIQYRNRSGLAICEGCHSDHYYLCGECGVSVFPQYWNYELDQCDSCVSDNYYSCDSCGSYGLHFDMFGTDIGYLCEYCMDEYREGCSIPNVLPYHSGAPWGLVFHDSTGAERDPLARAYYGVELESEQTDSGISDHILDLMDAHIGHAETDGSLDYGIEFITQPATLGAWRGSFGDHVRRYMAEVQNIGGNFADSNCGAHVHVSRTAFDSDAHLARFVTFMRHNESFILAISGRYSLDQWAKVNTYRRGDLRSEVKNKRGDRYRAVNLTNPNTVEVRLFAGTNDYSHIIGAIELIDALINYTRDLTISDINIGALLADSFIAWVSDPELSPTPMARELIASRVAA